MKRPLIYYVLTVAGMALALMFFLMGIVDFNSEYLFTPEDAQQNIIVKFAVYLVAPACFVLTLFHAIGYNPFRKK